MMQLIEANWQGFALALLIGLLVAWWLFGRSSGGARQRHHAPDVLDEGAAPAARNQALIDAPPAAQIPSVIVPAPVTGAMAGLGEVIAAAAQEEVDAVAEVRAAEPEPVPTPEPTPAPEPAPEPTAPSTAPASIAADDLARIKGLGPKLQALLPQLGLSSFAQIAALSEADLTELDGKLGAFAGRPARDQWVEQAKFLAAGDVAGFEAQFGKV